MQTVEFFLGSHERQVEFRYAVERSVGVTAYEMIDQHATPLEAERTIQTFVYESVVVAGRHLWLKLSRFGLRQARLLVIVLRCVKTLDMIQELRTIMKFHIRL